MADGIEMQHTAEQRPITVRFHRRNKNNSRFPINRLPFIDRKGRNCWAMPHCAGYGPGCDMGRAAAQAFLKALRAQEQSMGGHLQGLVIDLAKARFDLEGDAGRRGQVVGFFAELDHWLEFSAKHAGGALDNIDEKDIERRMTRAARESDDEYMDRHMVWAAADDD